MHKPREMLLKRPLHVVQVYRNSCMFQKGDLSPGQSRDFLRWPERLSSTGFVSNGMLHLPDHYEELVHINQYNIAFLLDDFSEDRNTTKAWIEKPVIFTQADAQIRLYFLRLKNKYEVIEIYMNGADYSWWPKRESHKLCELHRDKAVEIKINGKMDGHHQRYYMEEQFVLEDKGSFERIIVSSSQMSMLKKIPADRKLVDLREMLW